MDFKMRAVASLMAMSLLVIGARVNSAPVAVVPADFSVTNSAEESVLYELDASDSKDAVSFSWRVVEGKGVFWLKEKHEDGWMTEVNQAKAKALVPANHSGIAVYELQVTDSEGNTDTKRVTMTATSAQNPAVVQSPATANRPGSEYPYWSAESTYMTGDKVTFAGIKYIATKWTQSTPGSGSGWKFADPNQLVEWNKSMSYSSKDKVTWQGKSYQAAYWTQGNTPGEHSVWLELSEEEAA